MKRTRWVLVLWTVALVWTCFLLLSLKTGWLNDFFYDTGHSPLNGIDFFSVERAWMNLLKGQSEFDSFRSSYGPYATFYNYHPLTAIVVGLPLMFFSAWTAYAVWTGVSFVLLSVSGWLIATHCPVSLLRPCIMLLLTGSFPVFIMWQSGNVQALLVLATSLVLCAMDLLGSNPEDRRAQGLLLAGLLVSLFSKPTAIALLPMLLMLRSTRRTALGAAAVYMIVSYLSFIIPAWNPVAMTWAERLQWISHPAAIASNMNVYTNDFVVTRPMMDNSVHWFAMVGLTNFRWLHIDIYSLSTLLDGWTGTHTPDYLHQVPLLLVLELSLLVALVRDQRSQSEAALRVAMAASLLLILSYGVVWEYHYTLVLPVTALLLAKGARCWLDRAVIALGALAWLPGLYVFYRNSDLASQQVQTILRAERVLPVLIMFLLLLTSAALISLRNTGGLRGLSFGARN